MIVLSRSRVETPLDAELARNLAEHFRVPVLSIPFLYDLRSFGPTVERLREIKRPFCFAAPLPVRASENLLAVLLKSKPAAVTIADSRVSDPFSHLVSAFQPLPASESAEVQRIDEPTVRRWYPVVDTQRCTGCLECVNFCLFGVYVIGPDDRPLVDQPDACRDGCPACSRVCPARAILFPMHEDPSISGDAEETPTPDADRANEERRRHLETAPDGLDDLVDRIDRFSP